MAYGASVVAPMASAQDAVNLYLRGDMPPVVNPSVMEIKPLRDASAASLKTSARAMPPMANVDDLRRGRAEEAAAYAYAMKRAFATTKQYEKLNRKKAQMAGAAEQRQAKHYGKGGGRQGTSYTGRNRAMEKTSAWRAAHPRDRQFLTYLR